MIAQRTIVLYGLYAHRAKFQCLFHNASLLYRKVSKIFFSS